MGYLVRNGTDEETPLLGLQKGTRVPQLSDISVDKEGVAIKVSTVPAECLTLSMKPGTWIGLVTDICILARLCMVESAPGAVAVAFS